MKRCILLLVCLLVLAVGIVALQVPWWGPKPCPVDVRYETREMLKKGMSEQEVESILGGPAGDYRTREDVDYSYGLTRCSIRASEKQERVEQIPEPVTPKKWTTDEYAIHVDFDSHGKAKWIEGGCGRRPPPSSRYPPPLRQVMQLLDP